MNSLGTGSIPEPVITHVLEDDVTVVVLVSAGVLIGPFNGQNGTFVVVQATHIVATTIVVLRIKHSGGGNELIMHCKHYHKNVANCY